VTIAVVIFNLSSLSRNAEAIGLNPIEARKMKIFTDTAATLILPPGHPIILDLYAALSLQKNK